LPDLDDAIRRELVRLSRPGDPTGALNRVVRAKRRLRVMRRVQAAGLAVAVVAGTAGAVVALDRAFRPASMPGDQPQVGPTVTTSPSPSPRVCPWPGVVILGNLATWPEDYRPIGPPVTADVLGDGRDGRIQMYEDPAQPLRCRYVLVVDHPRGVAYLAPIRSFEWLPDQPTILMTPEIDGQPGVEIVADFGGPGHPHRSGQVFTYEPSGVPGGQGAVVPMRLRPPQGLPILFPLGGEFAAGVDCVDEPGTVVTTVGALAAGGDTHYDITRTTYRADGAMFVEVTSESFTVPVGEEDERWPELADDPFRSCPAA
jgi:hypothetical protein